jgi:hypothetical protein
VQVRRQCRRRPPPRRSRRRWQGWRQGEGRQGRRAAARAGRSRRTGLSDIASRAAGDRSAYRRAAPRAPGIGQPRRPTLPPVSEILPYTSEPPAVRPWDPRAPHVARGDRQPHRPRTPTCGPSMSAARRSRTCRAGVIDLAIPADPDDIPRIPRPPHTRLRAATAPVSMVVDPSDARRRDRLRGRTVPDPRPCHPCHLRRAPRASDVPRRAPSRRGSPRTPRAAKQRIVDAGEQSSQMYAVIKAGFVSDAMSRSGLARPAEADPDRARRDDRHPRRRPAGADARTPRGLATASRSSTGPVLPRPRRRRPPGRGRHDLGEGRPRAGRRVRRRHLRAGACRRRRSRRSSIASRPAWPAPPRHAGPPRGRRSCASRAS